MENGEEVGGGGGEIAMTFVVVYREWNCVVYQSPL